MYVLRSVADLGDKLPMLNPNYTHTHTRFLTTQKLLKPLFTHVHMHVYDKDPCLFPSGPETPLSLPPLPLPTKTLQPHTSRYCLLNP
jgi:hypothetical protein